ncbi:MAG: MaoC family dehydratase [Acidimicrobiia bacterium]
MTITWNDLAEGTEGPTREDPPLTVTDFVRYQGASGDMNPIHHDTDFAQKAGFPKPFAVGMLGAGVLAGWATDWLGAANVRRFKVQWREQAWPGDVLTYSGKVVAGREEDGQRLVDLEMAVTRQTGGTHLKGWATFVVPD